MIPLPAGDGASAVDVNKHGHVLAGVQLHGAPAGGAARSYVWRDGTLLEVPVAPSLPLHINDRGQVLTTWADPSSATFLWDGSTVTTFPGGRGALNERGRVAVPGENVPQKNGIAVDLWVDGSATRLPAYERPGSLDGLVTVHALNNKGQPVGVATDFYAMFSGIMMEARIWPGPQTSVCGCREGWYTDVNDAGTRIAVGRGHGVRHSPWAGLVENGQRAYLQQRTGEVLDLSSHVGLDTSADALNENGVVAGTFVFEGNRRAYTWENGAMVEVALSDAGLLIDSVHEINDRGQIAARAIRRSTGESVAVLLTPST